MRFRAFTVVELLIVIAIIGILTTLAVTAGLSASARSRDTARKADIGRLKDSLQQYFGDWRSYPTFDKKYGQAYAADWQLSGAPINGCHADGRLAPRYIVSIPRDPQQSTDLAKLKDCSDPQLTKGQTNRFLYLTGNSDANGPSNLATSFGLMVKLERPAAADAGNIVFPAPNTTNNPLINTVAPFGSWYSTVDNYGPGIGVNANYLTVNLGL
jgi:prepilin-type N-terminal cleavage/methylation domain-containing protein